MRKTTGLSLVLTTVGVLLIAHSLTAQIQPPVEKPDTPTGSTEAAQDLVDAEVLELSDLDFDAASAAYEAILELDASERIMARALFNLARVERKRGNVGRARELLERFLDLHPNADPLTDVARRVLEEIRTGEPEVEEFDWLEEFANDPAIRAQIFDAAVSMASKDERAKAKAKLQAMGPIALPIVEQVARTATGFHRARLLELLVEGGKVDFLDDLLVQGWNVESLARVVSVWDEARRRRAHSQLTSWLTVQPEVTAGIERSRQEGARALRLATGIEEHLDEDLRFFVTSSESSGASFKQKVEPFLGVSNGSEQFREWWSSQGQGAPRVALPLVCEQFPDLLTPEYLEPFRDARIDAGSQFDNTEGVYVEAWRAKEVRLDRREVHALCEAVCRAEKDWLLDFLVGLADESGTVLHFLGKVSCPLVTPEVMIRVMVRTDPNRTSGDLVQLIRARPELIEPWFRITWIEELESVKRYAERNGGSTGVGATPAMIDYALSEFAQQSQETRRYLAAWFRDCLRRQRDIENAETEWGRTGWNAGNAVVNRRGRRSTREVVQSDSSPSRETESAPESTWVEGALGAIEQTADLPNRDPLERSIGLQALAVFMARLHDAEQPQRMAETLDRCIFERPTEFWSRDLAVRYTGQSESMAFESIQALSVEEQSSVLIGVLLQIAKQHKGSSFHSVLDDLPLGSRPANRLLWATVTISRTRKAPSIDSADDWSGFLEWGLSSERIALEWLPLALPRDIFTEALRSTKLSIDRRIELLVGQLRVQPASFNEPLARVVFQSQPLIEELVRQWTADKLLPPASEPLADWMNTYRSLGLASESDSVRAWCLRTEDIHDEALQPFIDAHWRADDKTGSTLRRNILLSTHLAALRWLHQMTSDEWKKSLRMQVVERLDFFGDVSSLPVLQGLVSDPDIEVRNAAIDALTTIQDAIRLRELIERGVLPGSAGRPSKGNR